ncbi:hypothetical protein L596_012018 [Steinernema carpocapsae]|uniref:Uncharacterized protein n=1 Tax=Steinernema carpocapsae TaxID=34508 RepID=A0A4U5NWK7_STECR|nr:hypothetical protein L596_012018 [Steinernema carpocapsae]
MLAKLLLTTLVHLPVSMNGEADSGIEVRVTSNITTGQKRSSGDGLILNADSSPGPSSHAIPSLDITLGVVGFLVCLAIIVAVASRYYGSSSEAITGTFCTSAASPPLRSPPSCSRFREAPSAVEDPPPAVAMMPNA